MWGTSFHGFRVYKGLGFRVPPTTPPDYSAKVPLQKGNINGGGVVPQFPRESNILQKEEYTLDDARNSNVI